MGKSLRDWDLSPTLIRQFPPISSTSVGGARQLIFHIPRTDIILMGYLMKFKVGTICISARYRIRSITGVMDTSMILFIKIDMFLRNHLESIRYIVLIDNFRGRVGGLGDAL